MQQKRREFRRGERVIQHAIEMFDLVDITTAAKAGKMVDHRFLQPDVMLAATQYAEAENAYTHIAGNP